MQTEPVRVPTGPISSTTPRNAALTAAEFRQLGVARLAYVTGLYTQDGEINYVIHGADGIAVAVVDHLELVTDLAAQLGLVLVTVH
jgi:hypothetical protein